MNSAVCNQTTPLPVPCSLSLSLLSSSPQLHVCRSVRPSVRQSGASAPLRVRPPPQLSKAETRRCCRHCGHAVLAAVVGSRHPPIFFFFWEQNPNGVADTWEQRSRDRLIFQPCVEESGGADGRSPARSSRAAAQAGVRS